MATNLPIETADQIGDLLAHLLAGAVGGTEANWRRLIGHVEHVPTWRYVRHNWVIDPNGTTDQRNAIAAAVEIVRGEHPYVA